VGILEGGTFNLNAGAIKENKALEGHSGGGVYVYGKTGSFAINGNLAAVENNTAAAANSGGGVYNDGGGFTMNSGFIKGNRAEQVNSGGGAFGGLLLYGGTIQGNLANGAGSGGGVYVDSGRLLDMRRGLIAENISEAADSGGGVYIKGNFTMFNAAAVIAENIAKAANSGGGLYINGNFTLRKGFIQGNEAREKQSGGGLYIANGNGQLESQEEGVTIKGNKATNSAPGPDADSGGAVFVNGGALSFLKGTIGGTSPADANTAEIGANGVYIAGGQFTMSTMSGEGGIITGNVNGTNDYGVYVKSSAYNAFGVAGGKVAQNNKVFLSPGATIYLWANVSGSAPVAYIICDSPVSYQSNPSQATKLLNCGDWSSNCTYLNSNKHFFWYDENPIAITPAILAADNNYYGYYNK
jgi:hypothetical protein